MMVCCAHKSVKKDGRDRDGNQRFKCLLCGKRFSTPKAKPLGIMRVEVEDAKRVLHLLAEGSSIRSAERLTDMHRDTICRLLVHFGQACQRFLDARMKGLTLDHLEFDEQWTYVAKKQARLTTTQREEASDMGDIYLWTCVDQTTKLMPSFLIGKRSADNARRFLMDMAGRLVFPKPHASDDHAFGLGTAKPIVQISVDGFAGYPEAIDLAFGIYARWGVIIKEYRNAKIIYTPSEMVGTKRRPRRNMTKADRWSICTSHIERLNGTQRLMMKRLNRLTYCFSKKIENLQAAFAAFAAYYNYCWRTRKPGKSGRRRPTAATMAGLTDHTWTFDELFNAVLTS
ncbi:MAG: IS1 family transposase [Patescibacteria group bacterium]|nr:IS1 family transposase [Patescibacteria group bacterium]